MDTNTRSIREKQDRQFLFGHFGFILYSYPHKTVVLTFTKVYSFTDDKQYVAPICCKTKSDIAGEKGINLGERTLL